MCNEETHQTLTKPEHFVRHTMEVERACAATRRGLGNVSLEQAMQQAQEALLLADKDVSRECTHMLQLVVSGNLPAAARV
jgi:hypothetical protein